MKLETSIVLSSFADKDVQIHTHTLQVLVLIINGIIYKGVYTYENT
jgi:hypothetical protein